MSNEAWKQTNTLVRFLPLEYLAISDPTRRANELSKILSIIRYRRNIDHAQRSLRYARIRRLLRLLTIRLYGVKSQRDATQFDLDTFDLRGR